MKLYYCPGHMSFAAHVILHEIGIPFEAIEVSVKAGATQSEAFKAINPKGKVPVLDTGEAIITESVAIAWYLATHSPTQQLVPADSLGAARALEWSNWLSSILAGPVGQVVRPDRFSDVPDHQPGIKARGLENLRQSYAAIDQQLQGLAWALGEHYSIIDPMLLIFFKWGNQVGLDMRALTHWCTHSDRMQQRQAVRATLDIERISLW